MILLFTSKWCPKFFSLLPMHYVLFSVFNIFWNERSNSSIQLLMGTDLQVVGVQTEVQFLVWLS